MSKLSMTLAVSAALLPWLCRTAEACVCSTPGPPCQAFWRAEAVFFGQVRQISNVTVEGLGFVRRGSRSVRFSVERAWRGIDEKTVEILTGSGGGDCGYRFEEGERYGVYAYRDRETGKLMTNICMRTRHVSQAKEDLDYAVSLSHASSGARIYEKVSSHGPMAGVQVRLEGGGQIRETTTSSDGNYAFDGPIRLVIRRAAGF